MVLILKKSLSEGDRKKIMGFVKSLLKGAKFLKEDKIGQKSLSYPIKKETDGIYFDWSFDAESIPSEFGKKIFENANVLRHLLIRRK